MKITLKICGETEKLRTGGLVACPQALKGRGKEGGGIPKAWGRSTSPGGTQETDSVKSPKDARAEREQRLRVYGSRRSKARRGAGAGELGLEGRTAQRTTPKRHTGLGGANS